MQVLVTEASTPQALAVIRELGRREDCVVTALAREQGKLPALGLVSRYAEHNLTYPAYFVEAELQEYLLDRLHHLCWGVEDKPVLFPTGIESLRLLARKPEVFALEGHFLAPSAEALEVTRDKRRLAREALKCGVPTPKEIEFSPRETIGDLAARVTYPMLLKYWGGEKTGLPPARHLTRANDAKTLTKRYQTMYDVQAPVLLQRIAAGRSCGVALVMDKRSRPVAAMMHERVRQFPLCGGPGTLVRSIWMPELLAPSLRLLRHLEWRGLAMLELVTDGREATVIDLNARLWGSFPLARLCGADLSGAYVRAAHGEVLPEIGQTCAYETGREMQYFATDIQAACAMGIGPAADSVKKLFSRDVAGGVWDRDDPKPGWAYLRSFVMKRPDASFRAAH